jgi:hypothetical protein
MPVQQLAAFSESAPATLPAAFSRLAGTAAMGADNANHLQMQNMP